MVILENEEKLGHLELMLVYSADRRVFIQMQTN